MSQRSSLRFIPAIVLVISLGLTGIVSWLSYQQRGRDASLRLEIISERIRSDASERLNNHVSLIKAAVGFFEASKSTASSQQFQQFLAALELHSDYPGIVSLDFIKRVSAQEREAFESEQRRYRPGFHIYPASDRDTYYVSTYLGPVATDRHSDLGFDPYTEPVRRQAMETARDQATPAFSGRVLIAQPGLDTPSTAALVLFAPIYSVTPPPASVKERRSSLTGFIASNLKIDRLLDGLRTQAEKSLITFSIYAGKEASQDNLLMTTGSLKAQIDGLSKTETITIAGFPWTFRYLAMPNFESELGHAQSHQILGIGLMFSLLLFGFTTTQSKAREANERALRYERERARDLQDLDRAKTRFFSNLSHELRTPLNGILGMSDLLWDTTLNDQQKDYLTTIGTCGRTLLDLISDVLDVSKIEAKKLKLKKRPFKLIQPFSGALEVVRGQARGKNLDLAMQWDEKLPSFVEGDLVRLRQVLVNLLSNAVKFTDSGSITLKATLKSEGSALVQVKDTGVGITTQEQAKVFLPFSQLAASEAADSVKGTGLGLAISKELITLMGGQIGLTSEPGVGSTFYFEIPLTPVNPESPAAQSQVQPPKSIEAGLKLLVADDNPINLRVMLLQLQKLGYSVDGVNNGAKAVEAAQLTRYDLILMDCQMPILNGLEATRRIKNEVRPAPVIIALTAFSQPEQQAQCKDSGMDDFLTKPVDFARLVEVLDIWREKLIKKQQATG